MSQSIVLHLLFGGHCAHFHSRALLPLRIQLTVVHRCTFRFESIDLSVHWLYIRSDSRFFFADLEIDLVYPAFTTDGACALNKSRFFLSFEDWLRHIIVPQFESLCATWTWRVRENSFSVFDAFDDFCFNRARQDFKHKNQHDCFYLNLVRKSL